jgi:hypothetical protein
MSPSPAPRPDRSNAASAPVAIGVLWLAALLLAFTIAYPDLGAVLRFLAYAAGFSLLPGIVAVRLLLPSLTSLGPVIAYGLAAGIAINLLALMPLWLIGRISLLWALPAAALLAAVVLRRRIALGRPLAAGARLDRFAAAECLVVCATPLLTLGFLVAADRSTAFSDHFAFQGVLVQGLAQVSAHGWPPRFLLLADTPLSYNYAAHLWVLGAHAITGLPVEVLVARFGPVFFLAAAAAMLIAFSRSVLGLRGWYPALVVIAVFWIVGVAPLHGRVFGIFTAFGAMLVMSPSLGFLIFFLALLVALRGAVGRCSAAVRLPVLVLLGFVGTGARAPAMPVLICALGLVWLVGWRRRAPHAHRTLADMAALAVGFLAGLLVFFTVRSEISGSGFATFTGHPTYLTDPDQVMLVLPGRFIKLFPAPVAALLAFAVIVLFQASFFTPGVAHRLRKLRQDPPGEAEIALMGAAIAGIAAVFMTVAPGFSQFSFMHYTSLCLAMLGAATTQRALTGVDWRRYRAWTRDQAILVAATAALLVAQLVQLPADSFRWLGRQVPTALASLAPPWHAIPRQERTLTACLRDADADLLAAARAAAPDPVLVWLGLPPLITSCESRWAIVREPVDTIHWYSLEFRPGKARGALAERLQRQAALLRSAIKAAEQGRLAADDLAALAQTLADRPTFVFAPRSAAGEDPRLERVAENDRFVLFRVRLPRS